MHVPVPLQRVTRMRDLIPVDRERTTIELGGQVTQVRSSIMLSIWLRPSTNLVWMSEIVSSVS